jgi:UDP:flavonoid glycosyltransferase YjiC (YdhE family)
MSHLLVAITAHGFGHVAQTAPVINALRRRIPGLRLTLYTGLPRPYLAGRFEGEFAHVARAPDVGMPMKNALEVDVAASGRAYRRFHRDWETALEHEARLLADRAPDVVVANVPYRVLAAATRAGIPALALCSLNWTDIYRHFCRSLPEAPAVLEEMLTAYRSARAFLRPAPGMPMGYLDNGIDIGPIAGIGNERRAEIRKRVGLSAADKLVLVSLGGVPSRMDPANWPSLSDVCWIVPAAWKPRRDDTFALESLGRDFLDVLRSADALITKPGYGSFVEAACNGVPVLYAPRRDWPEEPVLVRWLHEHGRCLAVQRTQLERGDFAAALQQLFALPPRAPVIPSGIDEAVAHIGALL